MGFISPPRRNPLILRFGIWAARRFSGGDLLPAQLLAWYPKAAVSSAVMEGLIAHQDGSLDQRMLKLVRMAVSFHAGCPFCINMNSKGWQSLLSEQEVAALQGRASLEDVASFTLRERLAVTYARLVTSTPLHFPPRFIKALKDQFNEREIVILATTAAQVNYWTRLIQALGCPPEGVVDQGLFLDLPKQS